ncbi:unnamed protein product [Prorocentrum cordatum]|uniref:Uncharacterized protein n=1 Tax=Prorocentrum cordatum TaxID=2364126 RepID=A0ABN9V704_9DINO|nr:unnamed protein product [Polarella glacialis]
MKPVAPPGAAALAPQGPGEAAALRRRFAGGHAFVLLVLFAPPLTLCASLLVSLDVVFFVGRWWLSPLLLLPLALIFPLLTVVRPRPTGLILASVLTPCVVFILVGAHYASHTEVAVTTLRSRDCFALDDKKELARAHQVAEQIYRGCAEAVLGTASVAGCPGYREAAEQYGRCRGRQLTSSGARQFDYLESLEVRFPCAGICHRGLRLWGPGRGQEAPSCGLFVAEWMGAAHTQAEMVLAYSTVVALAAIPGTTVVLQPFLQNWYMRNAWPQL